MGNVVSDIVKNIDKAGEKEQAAKEQLEMLMKLADARLDTFQERLNRMFLDQDCMFVGKTWKVKYVLILLLLSAAAKMSVPGKRALRFERSVRVDTGAEVTKEPISISYSFTKLHCTFTSRVPQV
jgi:hypothetical protein